MVELDLLSNKYFEIISKLRLKLLEKGANTIATLPRLFKSLPSYDGRNHVNFDDFFNGLNSIGINVFKEDASIICKFIDKSNTRMLDIEEFLFAIRGQPNEERINAINLVFNTFDKEHTGVAKASDMKLVFNYEKHPKFRMKKLSANQMFYLYLKNFNNQVQETVTKKVIYIF